MRVAYILYNERPMSGILRSQVLALLHEIKKNSQNVSIELICFWQPHIFITHRKELKEMNIECYTSGIILKNYFICPPNRLFDTYLFTLSMIKRWIEFFLKVALKKDFKIIHTRAYYSGYFVSDFAYKNKIKHIFDPRSLFPDEMLASGIIKSKDSKYKTFKGIEKRIISLSDSNIAVSEGMREMMQEIYPQINVSYIPICVDTKQSNNSNEDKNEIIKTLGIKQSKVIAYCGSLSTNFNNNIYLYIKYMKFIISNYKDVHFLIITQSDIQKIMSESNIQKENYSICEASGPKLFSLLRSCDAGIFIMDPGQDRKTRLGIKFVEYLSAGIPVIVNSNVGSATKIVKEKGFGIILDLDNLANDSKILISFLTNQKPDKSILKNYAYENFDTHKVSHEYLKLYEKTLKNAGE